MKEETTLALPTDTRMVVSIVRSQCRLGHPPMFHIECVGASNGDDPLVHTLVPSKLQVLVSVTRLEVP